MRHIGNIGVHIGLLFLRQFRKQVVNQGSLALFKNIHTMKIDLLFLCVILCVLCTPLASEQVCGSENGILLKKEIFRSDSMNDPGEKQTTKILV